ncbi:hypothetical protein Tco_1309657 [Tanacetum coccineum]
MFSKLTAGIRDHLDRDGKIYFTFGSLYKSINVLRLAYESTAYHPDSRCQSDRTIQRYRICYVSSPVYSTLKKVGIDTYHCRIFCITTVTIQHKLLRFEALYKAQDNELIEEPVRDYGPWVKRPEVESYSRLSKCAGTPREFLVHLRLRPKLDEKLL